jgi:hypothetical protein
MQAVNYSPQSLTEPLGPMVWILEQPLVGALTLAAIGIGTLALLKRRDQQRLGLSIGAPLVVLAAAIFVVGSLVETDRERIEDASRAFVVAAVAGDLAELDRLILAEAALAISGRTAADDGRDRIEQLSKSQAQAGVIESWRVSRMQSTLDGQNVGTTQFRVRVTARVGDPALTWWKLHWRRDAQGVWRIWSIDCLAVNGREPGEGLYEWLRSAATGSRLRGF